MPKPGVGFFHGLDVRIAYHSSGTCPTFGEEGLLLFLKHPSPVLRVGHHPFNDGDL